MDEAGPSRVYLLSAGAEFALDTARRLAGLAAVGYVCWAWRGYMRQVCEESRRRGEQFQQLVDAALLAQREREFGGE